MKKIITLIVLALATLSLSAKEVAKNPITGLTLSEVAGVYIIKSDTGIIPLGNLEKTKSFLSSAHNAIVKETINDIFDCGKDQFEVRSDDQGYYITKVGLGTVKIRYSDIVTFGSTLKIKDLEPAAKKLWSKMQDGAGKIIDKL
jgi:hypothetical protein